LLPSLDFSLNKGDATAPSQASEPGGAEVPSAEAAPELAQVGAAAAPSGVADRPLPPVFIPRLSASAPTLEPGPSSPLFPALPTDDADPAGQAARPALPTRVHKRWPDKAFKGAALAGALAIVAALGGVAIFLLAKGAPALTAGSEDLPASASSFWKLALPLAFGSAWVSLIALVIAAPIAVGVALFITVYIPRRIAGPLGGVIDLLAAIPSVVYGLWGLMVLAPLAGSAYGWMGENLGWFPLFAGKPSATGRTILTGGVVLAVMVLPIMASLCREVFRQTPQTHIEAAYALGATRWEMIRMAVLPPARSGIISGAMLGLGRALGETMAIAMVLSPTPFLVTFRLINSENPGTVAAFIASNFPESHGMEVNALIALGLVLFAVTFAVNYVARAVIAGKAKKMEADA
jgi:phosphate transport system permease protein